jgi:hypothetical protein
MEFAYANVLLFVHQSPLECDGYLRGYDGWLRCDAETC